MTAKAKAERAALWGIIHDLRGQVRNCGCSAGALGGIGHLAALPEQAAKLAPGVTMRWLLTGDVDGPRPGVGDVLRLRQWALGDPAVRVTADPTSQLDVQGIIALIPTKPIEIQHRRILRPALDRGLAVDLLLVDARGLITEHQVMPVDKSLVDDPPVAAHFPDHLTATIVEASTPSTTCATCHPSAAKALNTGPHLQAWAKLPQADHTDSCVGCHSTPISSGKLAPAVHCQTCHQGGDAHGGSLGATRTTGTTACRTCHDAQDDPAFQLEKAWARILHAKEPAKP